jgi:radical SAM protein with 4Fe4S-binding SPASM domain
MVLKRFLENLFERLGLAEAPLPPPRSAHVSLAGAEQLRPVVARLAAWSVKRVQIVAPEAADSDELVQAVRVATGLGLEVSIRGRASDLGAATNLSELASAGACEVELPLLSAIAEVHDSLAGVGDHRCALKALDAIRSGKLKTAIQLVLTPSTWKTIERTLEMLDDRAVRVVRVWAVTCRDAEPSSWALSTSELSAAAAWIEANASDGMEFTWYPPLRFDPARTLAQQVRRGPHAARDAVRIDSDGSVIPPIGPSTAGGNVLQSDWKPIARSAVFRAWRRNREATARCNGCPGLAACKDGCLREEAIWLR